MEAHQLSTLLASAGLTLPSDVPVEVTGADPVLASRFAVGEVAAAALAACGVQASRLWSLRGNAPQQVRVDVRAAAASLLSFLLMRIDGEGRQREAAGNPCVALYECGDGRWIHLHGAFPHLRDGTLRVLGCDFDAASISAAVRKCDAQELEDALAAAGMCGAMVRTAEEWAAHPQGQALAGLPVVEVIRIGDAPPQPLPAGDAPLAGLRALDLTRVLAGPTCGRTLAQHGADVLRIASPTLPTVELFDIDTGHGKRSSFVDLEAPEGPAQLRALLAGADVFIDGYRSGALARRGFAPTDTAALRPGIVHVAINCYGHVGPWVERPGWEQLAQSACGLAAAEGGDGPPRLIAAAACDYTTGYLAAFGAMAALERRAHEGGSWLVRASLAQTAMWIGRRGASLDPAAATGIGDPAGLMTASETPFGRISHLRPAIELEATPARWPLPTAPLGSHPAAWSGG